jgi:hypothetical protein
MILASIWAFFGYLRPAYETIASLKTEKRGYEEVLDNANEVRILREKWLAVENSFSPKDLDRLAKMLPQKAQGIQLARDVDGLASIFGITITKISFAEAADTRSAAPSGVEATLPASAYAVTGDVFAPAPPPTPTGKVLELSFSFVTDYPNFMRFLRELERSLELSDVETLSMSRSKKDVEKDKGASAVSNQYAFSLKIHTYFLE